MNRRRKSCNSDGIVAAKSPNSDRLRCPRGTTRDRVAACGRRLSTTCKPSRPGMFVWRIERRRRGFPDGKATADFDREAAVARMLVGRRLRGVVPVLQVDANTIWEQKLDVNRYPAFDFNNPSDRADLAAGLDSLHRLGIVHCDIKTSNLGWDDVRKQWCLFDFDSSGVVDRLQKSQWLATMHPPSRPAVRDAMAHYRRDMLTDLRMLDSIQVQLQNERRRRR